MATFGPETYDGTVNNTTLIFEVIFGLSVLLKFNLEYKVEENPLPVRDYAKIADRYIKNEFIIDIIPLIPFP
jgi:hypothetical protein